MPFAAALSEHPITAYAVGEVCGQVLERIGTNPDVVIVFTTLAHAGALEDTMAAVGTLLEPSVAVGAASHAVIGPGREVEDGPAISVWAGRFGPVLPVRIPAGATRLGPVQGQGFDPSALVLVADPFSFEADGFLEQLAVDHPGLPVVGGLASGARGPGGSRLALGDDVFTDGGVGFLVGPGIDALPVLSQGSRPVGRPFVVTDGEGRIIRTLGGRTAMERLEELAGGLSAEEVAAVNAGALLLGRVVDEHKLDFEAGDFALRPVIGGDRQTGAIAVEDDVVLGTTVQFHIRDALAAHDDLEAVLRREAPSSDPQAALIFSCNGRGRRLFGGPDHDAGAIQEVLGPIPTAGMFAAGELAPLGGRNEMRSLSASMLLVREHR